MEEKTMLKKLHDEIKSELYKELTIDCKNCCGLCCTALYFSKDEGFPENKPAGKPCVNLEKNFRCRVHKELKQRKLKGCMAYDCFGAGQKVTQTVYQGKTWRDKGVRADEMYRIFLAVCQLHQMLWYLTEAEHLMPAADTHKMIGHTIQKIDSLTRQAPEALLKVNVEECRQQTNQLLRTVWQRVQESVNAAEKITKSTDCIGKNFKKAALDGQDLSMTLLIAANLEDCSLNGVNFLGADMRDANLKNADMQDSIFLTQAQINSAKGNGSTKLPEFIKIPEHWEN